MGKPNYLVQERDDQEQHVYAWTPVLAKKENMRPISDKEAREILDRQRRARELKIDRLHAEAEAALEIEELEEIEIEEDFENEVLEKIRPNADKTSPLDGEAKALVVTQEDILARQIEDLEKLNSKNSIEEYVLTKYKLPMLHGSEDVDEFRSQAVEILTTLAGANGLYE